MMPETEIAIGRKILAAIPSAGEGVARCFAKCKEAPLTYPERFEVAFRPLREAVGLYHGANLAWLAFVMRNIPRRMYDGGFALGQDRTGDPGFNEHARLDAKDRFDRMRMLCQEGQESRLNSIRSIAAAVKLPEDPLSHETRFVFSTIEYFVLREPNLSKDDWGDWVLLPLSPSNPRTFSHVGSEGYYFDRVSEVVNDEFDPKNPGVHFSNIVARRSELDALHMNVEVDFVRLAANVHGHWPEDYYPSFNGFFPFRKQ